MARGPLKSGCSACEELAIVRQRSIAAAENAFECLAKLDKETPEAASELDQISEEWRQAVAARRYIEDAIQKHNEAAHAKPPTRLIVVDDHDIVRLGLRALIERAGGFQVVGEASNGRDAVELARKLQPQIVLMDVSMPGMSGLDAASAIRESCPETHVIVVSMLDSEKVVREAAAAGVRGVLGKAQLAKNLIPAIRTVERGENYFDEAASRALLNGFIESPGDRAATAGGKLTHRERQVVQMLAGGSSNKEVASALSISVKTVETHRSHIMEKLGTRSFADLVKYAIRHALVDC